MNLHAKNVTRKENHPASNINVEENVATKFSTYCQYCVLHWLYKECHCRQLVDIIMKVDV